MQNRWILATIALAGAGLVASCAAGSLETEGSGGDDAGAGGQTASNVSSSGAGGQGQGGAGGAGGAGGEQGGAGGAGGEGGSAPVCGNGVLDPGESCDGSNFGTKTCETLGLGGGMLLCNQFCKIVASQCTPMENCIDSQDNDQDFLVDCQDDDCSMQPACLDSCAAPKPISLGYYFADTSGRPDTTKSSCSALTGPELIYELTAPATGDMVMQLNLGTDMSLSVRSACADVASEIACMNAGGAGVTETLTLPVVQGTTFFIVIDAAGPTEFGFIDFFVDIPLPESDCQNIFDDDSDSLTDCEDPTMCQGTPQCAPGIMPAGAPCFQPNECAANAGDPLCLGEFSFGWPDGYCSEFCDLALNDCPAGSVCSDYILFPSGHGVCLDTCASQNDCRAGYVCIDPGVGSDVCIY